MFPWRIVRIKVLRAGPQSPVKLTDKGLHSLRSSSHFFDSFKMGLAAEKVKE